MTGSKLATTSATPAPSNSDLIVNEKPAASSSKVAPVNVVILSFAEIVPVADSIVMFLPPNKGTVPAAPAAAPVPWRVMLIPFVVAVLPNS